MKTAFCRSQCSGQAFCPSLRSCPVEQNCSSTGLALNFRQDLASNLHFRQCQLPKFESRMYLEGRISKFL
jgi:hypothetical protein